MELLRRQEFAQAEKVLKQALQADPGNPEAHFQLGNLCIRQNRLAEAEDAYRHAAEDARFYAASFNLGNLLMGRGEWEDAAARFRTVLERKPRFVPALNNLGQACMNLKEHGEAIRAFETALALEPDQAQAHDNLAVALFGAGRLEEAEAAFRKAADLDPACAETLNNLACVQLERGDLVPAREAVERALRLDPGLARAHNTHGAIMEYAGEPEAAVASYARAVALDPGCADMHSNLGYALLLTGRLREGWREHEWRIQTSQCPPRTYAAPRWDGTARPGLRLLVHGEQGLGDTVQFCRYLRLLPGGMHVLFAVQPGLGDLLSRIPGADEVFECDPATPLPADRVYDAHVPLLSIPGLLGTTLETIPGEVPYLVAEPERVARMKALIARRGSPEDRLRVGILWAGNPNHARDRFRSCRLEHFAALAELPFVRLYSLQQGPARSALGDLAPVIDLAPECTSLPDAAAALSALDLLVSVDTLIVHLAGALGVPVCTLLPFAPDWRWLTGREDSPWYPSMRLYRQTRPGDWQGVLQRIAADLGGRRLPPAKAIG